MSTSMKISYYAMYFDHMNLILFVCVNNMILVVRRFWCNSRIVLIILFFMDFFNVFKCSMKREIVGLGLLDINRKRMGIRTLEDIQNWFFYFQICWKDHYKFMKQV